METEIDALSKCVQEYQYGGCGCGWLCVVHVSAVCLCVVIV